MNRREFMQVSAATAALASSGLLPLLAEETSTTKPAKKRPGKARSPADGPRNIFTEPPAIEPITGYLPKFSPAARGSMRAGFAATYALVQSHGSAASSNCSLSGSLDVSFAAATCKVREVRRNRPDNVVESVFHCAGELNTVKTWSLRSSVEGMPDVDFKEAGVWDSKAMTVKSDSWTQRHATSLPLIAQWALLPLLASGTLKSKPLRFDMLDNSALRADQTLRYCGQIEIPLAKATAKLDCYAQTGCGILPTHYIVDGDGRVQLITQETVNWALTRLA